MEANRLTTTDHSRDSAGMRYVYPVVSRRAGGVSIGINLNPNNACNWQCIYCQVPGLTRGTAPPVDLPLLRRELEALIAEVSNDGFMRRRVPEGMRRICDIALSGNGEPTSAKEFREVIGLAGSMLVRFKLDVPVRVITNGSLIGREYVQDGLRRLAELGGEAWFKVDAGTEERILEINGVRLEPETIRRNLRRCMELCPTWVQTCMFSLDGQEPSPKDIEAYLNILEGSGARGLRGVHLYGLARPSLQPGAKRLKRLAEAKLQEIAAQIRKTGLTVTVSP